MHLTTLLIYFYHRLLLVTHTVHGQDSIQLEIKASATYLLLTLINLNSYGQILLLFIFPLFCFILTLCKCCL